MKTNKWAKLIHVLTHAYAPFLLYSVLFIAFIITLMSILKIDSYHRYECSVSSDQECLIVAQSIPYKNVDYLYIYTNKNDNILKLKIKDINQIEQMTHIYPEEVFKSFVEKNAAALYYIEIPIKTSVIKSILASER